MQCLSKFQCHFFIEIEQIILKFVWNYKNVHISKAIWRKNRAGGMMLLDLKLYYKAIVTKSVGQKVCSWHKIRHIDQHNKKENPKIKTHMYHQLIIEKGSKIMKSENGSLFNKWCWETEQPQAK